MPEQTNPVFTFYVPPREPKPEPPPAQTIGNGPAITKLGWRQTTAQPWRYEK